MWWHMVVIAVPAEGGDEQRVALSPETAKKFVSLGCEVRIEKKAGEKSGFYDAEYEDVGVVLADTDVSAVKDADIILKVGRPNAEQIEAMKSGASLVCIMNPHDDRQEIEAMARAGINAFAMDFMPRITRAQSMDVLSSQSNLAGYKAVINAAATFNRAMPMMMTAAGTVPPAKVFVMGVGVAGLQAVATAKRLGAVVSATDVRPATKEQVASLGAKFIAVEDEEFKQAETAGGYAKQMSEEYQQKQAELVASHLAGQDIVITTALIPGRPAPELISRDMVETMRPGSIIVDMAAERGGNCALTEPGKTLTHEGVVIMGSTDLAGQLAVNASGLYARNVHAFVETMIDKDKGTLAIDREDELIAGTLVAHDGKLVHPALQPQEKK
jgi:NAD(P) transhydrogenase subunit alpha